MPHEPARCDDAAIWVPSAEQIEHSGLADYLAWLRHERAQSLTDYRQLWEWSVNQPADFWLSIRDHFGLDISDPQSVLDHAPMPHTTWFAGAVTNYARQALVHNGTGPAIVSLDEFGHRSEMSWGELRSAVAALSDWLRASGVRPGDRVVAYLPNIAAAVVGLLASAAVGAIWASCSPDYSAAGAADRFGQLEPSVLIVADGYCYGGARHDRRAQAAELAQLLPSVTDILTVDNIGLGVDLPGATRFDAVTDADVGEPVFADVAFDHPLWVLFSSGTTGKPKGIVHGHGGILLEHAKFLALHADLRAGSRFLWLATPSWMVWNMQVSGLVIGATIVTYDGNPTWPDATALWRLVGRLQLDFLGTSAAALTAAHRAGGDPADVADLSRLRAIGSTGSPLASGTAEWVAARLPHVWLSSASGGTDICSAFAGGIPTQPVYADRIQGALLGVRLEAWDAEGHPVIGATGDMVVTQPMPSMPQRFWDDPDDARYLDAYFDRWPGVWRHGDWITITADGGVIVHGRSDATMNRHGVRIGSGEIYDVVEQLDFVTDSLIVGVELVDGGYWMPLFVVCDSRPADAENRIRVAIRQGVSPRHVPDDVIVVDVLPHTRTGKKLEVPVKRILMGADPRGVVNPAAVDRPDALDHLADVARTAMPRTPATSGAG